MVISLILLFFTCMSLSFVEERLRDRDKLFFYCIFGVAMILIAGMREVGSTPDTDSYEALYYAYDNEVKMMLYEPTFNIIANFLQSLSLGVNALFFAYAIISIPIHLTLFWKMSKLPLLTLTIYISYYYMMHEMVQIRAGVAAGLFLWAIYFYVQKRKLLTLIFIVWAILFHYSAAAGLVIFLFSNRLPNWQRVVLCALVPIGLAVYFSHINLATLIPDELGGAKLMRYRELEEQGNSDLQEGWKLERNLLIWLNIMVYYVCIFFHDYLVKHFKYVTIAIKVQALAFCFLFFVNGISKIVGNRMNDFYSVSSILLWTASFYVFYPQLLSKLLSNIISTFRFVTGMIAYALALLWMK